MIRDPGTSQNIGFGIQSRDLNLGNGDKQGSNPEGSTIAKKLHDHPILKFAATAAVTMVGMHVAGNVVRKGGLKLGEKLTEASIPFVKKSFQEGLTQDYLSIRKTLDAWEGVFRADDGTVVRNLGMSLTSAEKSAFGTSYVASPAEESFKDIIRQRLVSQARRLPYELPAAYIVQKAPGIGTDDLFGNGDSRDKPNWYNPFDVIADFTKTSAMNLTTMILPMEAGGAATKAGWQKILSYGDGVADTTAKKIGVNLASSLNLVGQETSVILDKTAQMANRSAAGISAGITEAVSKTRSPVEEMSKKAASWNTVMRRQSMKEKVSTLWASDIKSGEALDMLQPFGGLRRFWQGYSSGVARYDEDYQHLLAYRSGYKTLPGSNVAVDRHRAQSAASRSSTVEQIASGVRFYGGGYLGRNDTQSWKLRSGEFYQQESKQFYKEYLRKQLQSTKGIDPKAVDALVDRLQVGNLPRSVAGRLEKSPIYNRLGFSKDFQPGSAEEFVGNIQSSLGSKIPGLDGVLAQLPDAVGGADRQFAKNLTRMDGQIRSKWINLYEQGISTYASRRLGSGPVGHELLGDLRHGKPPEEALDFLARSTASEINKINKGQGRRLNNKGQWVNPKEIPLRRTSGFGAGTSTRTSSVMAELSNYGFSPGRPEQMSNFLKSRGVITKNTSAGGFNIFGLKRLSVEEALDNRYFIGPDEKIVRDLIGNVGRQSDIGNIANTYRNTPVGHVWKTRSGQIIDLSTFSGATRRIMDTVSDQLQVPLVHIRPMNVFGYGALQKTANVPIFQIISGQARQPFIDNQITTPQTEALLFGKMKGGRGHVWQQIRTSGGPVIGSDGGPAAATFGLKQLPGMFRSMPTDPSSLLGRSLRFGIGETGKSPDVPRTGWKKFFDVSADQPDSILGLAKRFRGRKTDLRNPSVMAKRLLDGMDDPEQFRQTLANATGEERRQFAESWQSLQEGLRVHGIKADVIDEIIADGGPLADMLKVYRDPSQIGVAKMAISDLKKPQDVVGAIQAIQKTDLASGDKELRSLYNLFLKRHANGFRNMDSYFKSAELSQDLRQSGIHTRMDEVKADLVRYMMVREGAKAGDFNGVLNDLLSHLDDMKSTGRISKADYTEARAAAFSIQLNFLSVKNYKPSLGRQAENLGVAQAVVDEGKRFGRDSIVRQALEDIAGSRLESGGSIVSAGKGFLKRHLGIASYKFPGTEYNPFGDSPSAIVPTMGTQWRTSGALKTMGSVLGVTTWSDPSSFSGASVVSSHGLQRLNKFLTIGGLGLNEENYRGPLDFYARGMVGRRVAPMVIAGTTALALDRQLGGFVNHKDQNGNRNYSPLVLGALGSGVAFGEAAAAGITPGGKTYQQKMDELTSGEVAIRRGRWWPLGSTPFRGGRVEQYRPSWYRRLRSGWSYTDQDMGSPLEKLAFGYDFSPLRPLDPYRFERRHVEDRPYPQTGEYFSGPWGPLTPLLNMTVGKILKPTISMHKDEVQQKLSQYQFVGADAMAGPPVAFNNEMNPLAIGTQGSPSSLAGVAGAVNSAHVAGAGFGGSVGGRYTGSGGGVVGSGGGGGMGMSVGGTASTGFSPPIAAMQSAGLTESTGTEAQLVQNQIAEQYRVAAAYPKSSTYGVIGPGNGFTPKVIGSGKPMKQTSLSYQAGDFGYKTQEMLGIYGFSFSMARGALGLGNKDMSPKRPVLATPTYAAGMGRSFWDLNLGGLGDTPLPIEGDFANLELSEFARRFIPKERSDINYVNPIANTMGKENPWLPGADYMTNFHEGDPFGAISMGAMRLPGAGYEKLNALHPDQLGKYGALDRFKILGDVAPWSNEYRAMDKSIDASITNREQQNLVNTVRYQVSQKKRKDDFTPYENYQVEHEDVGATITQQLSPTTFMTDKFTNPISLAGVDTMEDTNASRGVLADIVGKHVQLTIDKNRVPLRTDQQEPIQARVLSGGVNMNRKFAESDYGYDIPTGSGLRDEVKPGQTVRGLYEKFKHEDTFFHSKFFHERTATEDWERDNVYGQTFPQWNHPIKDFLKPAVYKAGLRGPILGAVGAAAIGSLFGSTPEAKTVGTLIGGTVGFIAGGLQKIDEAVTGQRFIPKQRKEEVAVEEYSDILSYIRATRLQRQADMQGNTEASAYFQKQAQGTMYGMDVNARPDQVAAALPERKREHFKAMLRAPVNERPRILSTAGRLERRAYEAAWGQPVEERPDLVGYFKDKELPDENWEGWQPDADMNNVKIKVAQSLGLDVSQMGYYPQQVQQANQVNMSYPDIQMHKNHNVEGQLRRLMFQDGISGNVRRIPTGFGDVRTQLQVGAA